MKRPIVIFATAVAATCMGTLVTAQQTREAAIAAEQAAKAKDLHPYVPSAAEKLLVRADLALTQTKVGFYPNLGSVYSGGGFSLGVGYRRFYGDRAIWNLSTLFSIKSYKSVELSTSSPGHARGRVDLRAAAGFRDATEVAFFGIGMDTPSIERTNFRMKERYFTGAVEARPLPAAVLGATASYESYRISEGLGSTPSVTTVYSPQAAPGITGSPAFLHSTASAGIDWRPSAGYARRGGLYEIRYHKYADQNDVFSFDRVDGELVQHIPLLRDTWVLSLRGDVQTTLHDNDTVPFFLLPSLGSGSTLRGYASWRFRDRHSMLVSAEWRWIPSLLGLDMAFFYDAGKVTARRGDLNFDDLSSDVGVGARFHGPAGTPFRFEVAHGQEGFRLVFAGGPAF